MNKRKRFDKIVKDIKDIRIQGARNISKAALKAYFLIPTKASKKKLLASRPTEPMMQNVLEMVEKENFSQKKLNNYFDESQKIINKNVLNLVKNKDVIFTHCHSSNVTKSLINAKKNGKKFEVYNTETRPLYQGRKTAKELGAAKIKTTMFIDSAFAVALAKTQGTKKTTKIFMGADALLKEGIINKIGSRAIAEIARQEKIPVYIIADFVKFTKKKLPIEHRKMNEVWEKVPKGVRIRNPAFEFVPKKFITGIVSGLGVMKYGDFIKKVS